MLFMFYYYHLRSEATLLKEKFQRRSPELMVWLKKTLSIRSSVYSASLNAFR